MSEILESMMSAIHREEISDGADGQRITRAIEYLTENFELQPSLDEAAQVAGLSSLHFQRLFTRYVGISPKKFIQHLALKRTKESLARSASALDAAYVTGLSGPGRLHNLFVVHESLTLGEWKARGAGKDLAHGWHPSPFGDCLIVASERGVCGLAFELEEGRDATVENLFTSLGDARRKEDASLTKRYANLAFDGGELKVILRGTPFQLKVWEGLLRIPPGTVASYEGLARTLGRPTATRAVAGAIARNPVSWLVPCHRVLRGTGAITGYRWGPIKKRSMLAYEAAAQEEAAA
tara:strand:- start:109 stop:990 length:882 start_codon:yes stop_codon:yes gene_type:complete